MGRRRSRPGGSVLTGSAGSVLQQEAEGEHQRADEDGAEAGAGDDPQEHRGGPEAPDPGQPTRRFRFLPGRGSDPSQ